jgi:hypothetical protein
MSLLRWFAFTETSVEAGKNNEYLELNAYGPASSGLLYRSATNWWTSTSSFMPQS